MQQTFNHGADGRAMMQRNVVARFSDGKEVMIERRNGADNHPAANQAIHRTGLDGEARREERNRI